MDVDDAHLDDVPGLTNAPDARKGDLFHDRNVAFVDIDAHDAHKAVVPVHRNDRLVLSHDVPAHFTRIDVGRLQSPMPSFVVTRYRNSTTTATGRLRIVVFACIVFGAWIQVLPASTLYCHS